ERYTDRNEDSFGDRGMLAHAPTTLENLVNLILILTGLFLIGVVLIQRGKGGGLAGAFGGVGGSSPIRSKAGDAFTKFTIYVAVFWILLTMVQVKLMNRTVNNEGESLPGVVESKGG